MTSSGGSSIETLAERGYQVKIGAWLTQGWELCQRNIGPFIGFVLIVFAINLALGFLPIAGPVISILINNPLIAGYYIVAFKLLQGESTEFGDFFKGFENFVPLLVAGLLVSVFTLLGTLLCILPGIYLAVGYFFVLPILVDAPSTEAWPALETSRKVVTKQWFALFGFGLVLFLVNLLGAMLCGLGLLLTVPITFCAIAVAYRDLQAQAAAL